MLLGLDLSIFCMQFALGISVCYCYIRLPPSFLYTIIAVPVLHSPGISSPFCYSFSIIGGGSVILVANASFASPGMSPTPRDWFSLVVPFLGVYLHHRILLVASIVVLRFCSLSGI